MAAVERAGYTEKQATLPDGAVVNYAQSPGGNDAQGRSKPPLLLVHGQATAWQSYANVLPALAEDFRVYAVDCFGHGGSAHTPALYSAQTHGEALATFVREVVGEPVVVSGHSSGGVLAAWLAGNAPDQVRAVMLEDPPLFATQLPRARTTWNWGDLATAAHTYLADDVAAQGVDWATYSWMHQRMWKFFGDGAQGIIDEGLRYRSRHPGEPIQVWFIPQFDELNRYADGYDPRFGDAFYTGEWDKGFDTEATLRAITAPTTLVHTRVAYDDGILMAAMGHEEVARARALISNVKFVKVETGHGFHNEDPDLFVTLVRELG